MQSDFWKNQTVYYDISFFLYHCVTYRKNFVLIFIIKNKILSSLVFSSKYNFEIINTEIYPRSENFVIQAKSRYSRHTHNLKVYLFRLSWKSRGSKKGVWEWDISTILPPFIHPHALTFTFTQLFANMNFPNYWGKSRDILPKFRWRFLNIGESQLHIHQC